MAPAPDYLKTEITRLEKKIKKAQALLDDPQLKSLATQEIADLTKQKETLLKSQETDNQPNDQETSGKEQLGSAIIEVRAAAGGEEAKIWAQDLVKMYTRFANAQKMPVLVLGSGVIKVKGKQAYPTFKYEAGVHRVQRVPVTESSGRIHTSTATVAVLPEVSPAQVKIDPHDVDMQFYHSSSQGGQNVQKVSTAVRLTHKPTGIVVESQTQRYQEQNRKIAYDLLRSKLFSLEEEKRLAKMDAARSAIGRGMRAEKIRTYNFPQNRVTDHRLKKSWQNLDKILAGNLLPVVKALKAQLK